MLLYGAPGAHVIDSPQLSITPALLLIKPARETRDNSPTSVNPAPCTVSANAVRYAPESVHTAIMARVSTQTVFGFGCGLDWRPTSFVPAFPSTRVCSACGLVPPATTTLPCRHLLCEPCYK
ncbi:hypothetical protein HPB49_020085 [Dermacentor silvarum]|uniref:Uncharacterized protein n=1 Tax=Dermacentor silvarum TaxID=543639 RepID=A0ACB8CSZ9_DERSI|nr:hypothetical protein HPB49_020085 [Dermacentor silvarum]